VKPAKFVAQYNPALVVDFQQMLRANAQREQVVDARPPGRFRGEDPEPRPNLKQGRMPFSVSVPSLTVLEKRNPSDEWSTFLQPDKFMALLKQAGVNPSKPIINACGSGVTAAVVCLAEHLAGLKNYSIYDGSFTEWGQISANRPVLKHTEPDPL